MVHLTCRNIRSAAIYLIYTLIVFVNACSSGESLPDPLEAGWEGKKVCEVLEDNPKMRILKCTFPPGVGHEKHYHNPHFGYTIKGGKFRITDSTGTREVDIPDGYTFKNDRVEHEVLNIGDSTSVYIIIEPK